MSTLALPNTLLNLTREREKNPWQSALLTAAGVHILLVVVGFYSPKNTLLELMNQGETLAVSSSDSKPEEKILELDLTPPPPPVDNPEFINPQEVAKKIEPVVKPKPQPIPEQRPVATAPQFAASNVRVGNEFCPTPEYPYEAKLHRYQGTVDLSISIIAGAVADAEVTGSSGYGILDSSAASWIREHWHFPSYVNGNYKVPVQYTLKT